MMIKFCSITTLPEKWRKHIYDNMSYENGGMRCYLDYNLPKCKLALKFLRKELVCWSIFCSLDLENDKRPFVGAWTVEKLRRQGHATHTVKSLLCKHGITSEQPINVYRMSTRRILARLRYNPIQVGWSLDKLQDWLKSNFDDRR
jgi:hypothetical protein